MAIDETVLRYAAREAERMASAPVDQGYQAWYAKVDQLCVKKWRQEAGEFANFDFHAMYKEGLTPAQAFAEMRETLEA